ncbi:hypothetical protein [Fulvivirga sp.]|uniref:hypothetical protein n=1 Tax=Fulvivirga sp. TaxID=1931237 RepID=UPI0032EF225E
MNKFIFCFFALCSLTAQILAQESKEPDYYLVLDSAVKDKTGLLRLNHVLKNEFSRIIKTNTNGTVGNYVGLSTKDDNLSFAYSFVRKVNVFQITGGGKVNEGITNIVSDSKLNGGVSLGLNYYRMFGQKSISIVFDEVKSLQKKDQELTHAFELYNLTDHKKKAIEAFEKKKDEIQKLEATFKKLQTIRAQLLVGSSNTYIDSALYMDLNYKKGLIKIELANLQSNVNTVKGQVNQTIRQLQQTRDHNPNRNASHQQFVIDSLLTLKPLYTLTQSLKVTEDSLKTINKQIKANTFEEKTIDEIKNKLTIAIYELKVIEEKLKNISNGWELGNTYNTYIKNKRSNADKLDEIHASSIDLKWFGFGFGLENSSFKLLDSLSVVSNETDLIPTFNFSLTRYVNKLLPAGLKGRHISYTTFAAKLKFGNNLSTLKEINIERSDSLTANTSSTSSQKAYSGTFEDHVLSGQLSLDHYRFIGNKENYGFHLRAQTNLLESQTITSIRLGVLFAALKQEDEKSVVNFELFYGLNDILKDGEEDSLFGRNVIGIQTTIPFNFNL